MLNLRSPSIDESLRQAIAEKKLIEIRYKGDTRVVEPHDYGHHKGADRLLGYQLRMARAPFASEAIGWRLFDVPRIESLVILDMPFKGSRVQSAQDHHVWDNLYARVE